jgi:hypothetical protein
VSNPLPGAPQARRASRFAPGLEFGRIPTPAPRAGDDSLGELGTFSWANLRGEALIELATTSFPRPWEAGWPILDTDPLRPGEGFLAPPLSVPWGEGVGAPFQLESLESPPALGESKANLLAAEAYAEFPGSEGHAAPAAAGPSAAPTQSLPLARAGTPASSWGRAMARSVEGIVTQMVPGETVVAGASKPLWQAEAVASPQPSIDPSPVPQLSDSATPESVATAFSLPEVTSPISEKSAPQRVEPVATAYPADQRRRRIDIPDAFLSNDPAGDRLRASQSRTVSSGGSQFAMSDVGRTPDDTSAAAVGPIPLIPDASPDVGVGLARAAEPGWPPSERFAGGRSLWSDMKDQGGAPVVFPILAAGSARPPDLAPIDQVSGPQIRHGPAGPTEAGALAIFGPASTRGTAKPSQSAFSHAASLALDLPVASVSPPQLPTARSSVRWDGEEHKAFHPYRSAAIEVSGHTRPPVASVGTAANQTLLPHQPMSRDAEPSEIARVGSTGALPAPLDKRAHAITAQMPDDQHSSTVEMTPLRSDLRPGARLKADATVVGMMADPLDGGAPARPQAAVIPQLDPDMPTDRSAGPKPRAHNKPSAPLRYHTLDLDLHGRELGDPPGTHPASGSGTEAMSDPAIPARAGPSSSGFDSPPGARLSRSGQNEVGGAIATPAPPISTAAVRETPPSAGAGAVRATPLIAKKLSTAQRSHLHGVYRSSAPEHGPTAGPAASAPSASLAAPGFSSGRHLAAAPSEPARLALLRVGPRYAPAPSIREPLPLRGARPQSLNPAEPSSNTAGAVPETRRQLSTGDLPPAPRTATREPGAVAPSPGPVRIRGAGETPSPIRVTIGRITIADTPSFAASRGPRRPKSPLSLSAYLARRRP